MKRADRTRTSFLTASKEGEEYTEFFTHLDKKKRQHTWHGSENVPTLMMERMDGRKSVRCRKERDHCKQNKQPQLGLEETLPADRVKKIEKGF